MKTAALALTVFSARHANLTMVRQRKAHKAQVVQLVMYMCQVC